MDLTHSNARSKRERKSGKLSDDIFHNRKGSRREQNPQVFNTYSPTYLIQRTMSTLTPQQRQAQQQKTTTPQQQVAAQQQKQSNLQKLVAFSQTQQGRALPGGTVVTFGTMPVAVRPRMGQAQAEVEVETVMYATPQSRLQGLVWYGQTSEGRALAIQQAREQVERSEYGGSLGDLVRYAQTPAGRAAAIQQMREQTEIAEYGTTLGGLVLLAGELPVGAENVMLTREGVSYELPVDRVIRPQTFRGVTPAQPSRSLLDIFIGDVEAVASVVMGGAESAWSFISRQRMPIVQPSPLYRPTGIVGTVLWPRSPYALEKPFLSADIVVASATCTA